MHILCLSALKLRMLHSLILATSSELSVCTAWIELEGGKLGCKTQKADVFFFSIKCMHRNWLWRSLASILWVFVNALTRPFSMDHKNVRKTFLRAPRKTIHFCNFKRKALYEVCFLCTLEQRKTLRFFEIQKCLWVTYEHMKLAQVKTYLTIAPSKETKKE